MYGLNYLHIGIGLQAAADFDPSINQDAIKQEAKVHPTHVIPDGDKHEAGGGGGWIVFLLIMLIGGGSLAYYLLVYKKKQGQ